MSFQVDKSWNSETNTVYDIYTYIYIYDNVCINMIYVICIQIVETALKKNSTYLIELFM